MTDADLFQWLQASEIDFVREYVSRIRYRRLFKVALLRPLVSFEKDAKKRLLSTLDDIKLLIEAERELSENLGSVVLDVVVPELGEKKLSKIPLLVGGERGFDIVPLDESKEGTPLLQTLKQQTYTIPSVRVYCDPKLANDVRKRFDTLFPAQDLPNHREEEYDLTEY